MVTVAQCADRFGNHAASSLTSPISRQARLMKVAPWERKGILPLCEHLFEVHFEDIVLGRLDTLPLLVFYLKGSGTKRKVDGREI
jgi:hypothetical protein